LKLKYDEPLSNFGLKSKLRRYTTGPKEAVTIREQGFAAGAYTRPLFSST